MTPDAATDRGHGRSHRTHIRDAVAHDAAAIAAIYNHYIAHTVVSFELEPIDAEDMRMRLQDVLAQGLPWIVAEEDRSIVGYAYASRWRARAAYRESVESSVYLAPEATGRGMGRALYDALLPKLRAAGLHTVIGGITLPNAASVALHEALGFTHVGTFREVGHKFGARIDVGYWQKPLRT